MLPKLLLPVFAAASVFVLAAALAAPRRPVKPASAPPPHAPLVREGAAQDKAIGLTLGMDKNSYTLPGPPSSPPAQIHATLTFFNRSATPLHLHIGGLPCSWQILDAQNHIVWDYAVGRAIPHFIRLVTLTNNQLRYAQDISLQAQDGTPLAPGRYTLRGVMPGAMGASASLDFTVAPN